MKRFFLPLVAAFWLLTSLGCGSNRDKGANADKERPGPPPKTEKPKST